MVKTTTAEHIAIVAEERLITKNALPIFSLFQSILHSQGQSSSTLYDVSVNSPKNAI
jgi:hypothetical protein